jgi:hypothetical protein
MLDGITCVSPKSPKRSLSSCIAVCPGLGKAPNDRTSSSLRFDLFLAFRGQGLKVEAYGNFSV